MSTVSDGAAVFESLRPRLFGLAYRMLGSAAEAEDVVQDAYVRWHRADQPAVTVPAAWLTRVVTNLCLTRLESARSRRERYVGPWLPEPVLTQQPSTELGPLETTEQRDSVSIGLLLLLERLSPSERAVYVLKHAFDYSHREIASLLDISEANSQQLFSRARRHVDSQPRFTVDEGQWRRIVETFFAATQSAAGLDDLKQLLADDVVTWADGGGKVPTARRAVRGADKVARYMSGGLANLSARNIGRFVSHMELYAAQVNAGPALLALSEGTPVGVMVPTWNRREQVTALHVSANPDKLRFLGEQLSGVDLGEPLFRWRK